MRPRSQSQVGRRGFKVLSFVLLSWQLVVATGEVGDGSETLSLVLPRLHRKKGALECEHGTGAGSFEVRGGA